MGIDKFPQDQWTFTLECTLSEGCQRQTQDAHGFQTKTDALKGLYFSIETVMSLKLVPRPIMSGSDDFYDVLYVFDIMYSPSPIYVVFVHQFKTTPEQIHERIQQRSRDEKVLHALEEQFSDQ